MGNAVHNSVEDICNLDISDREDDEVGLLTLEGVDCADAARARRTSSDEVDLAYMYRSRCAHVCMYTFLGLFGHVCMLMYILGRCRPG